LICGILTPTNGNIQANGRIAALLELGSGFNPEFTGQENVYMNGSVLGLTKEEIDFRFQDIVQFADIGSFIYQPTKTYSSGMLMRLAFSVAINVEPHILVVDEALSVGDELFQRKCFSRIEKIKKNGTTIMLVSHSGGTIIELCDKGILLDSGEKLTMGDPKDIIGKYQKLIYAPPDQREQIRDDIQKNDTSSTSCAIVKENIKRNKCIQYGIEEYFDPNLKPQSTIVFEPRGAYLMSPEILTLDGKKVNYLRRGGFYKYSYKVRFEKSANSVRFAMLIKTLSGMEIGGAVSSTLEQSIAYVQAGMVIDVEFCFVCNLNPGLYFMNAGVTGVHDNEETYLHRMLDFYMFKVMPEPGSTATSIVDFGCVAKIHISNEYMEKMEPHEPS
jgi:lipopolysaccharide transport system ATP-binding protein